jgi:hypothetical protein
LLRGRVEALRQGLGSKPVVGALVCFERVEFVGAFLLGVLITLLLKYN